MNMRKPTLIFLSAFIIFCSCTDNLKDDSKIAEKIIMMEKEALERWNNGDPSGFLELSSLDVVYFDPMTEKRLDGHEELTLLYESLRGKIQVDSFSMPNPKVQLGKDMAVLTFNL